MAYTDLEKRRANRRAYYERNKGQMIARVGKNKRRVAVWLEAYKRTLSCTACGLSFRDRPECADFHHRDPAKKDFSVSSWRGSSCTIDDVAAEIEKCDALCANCHRTLHAKSKRGLV